MKRAPTRLLESAELSSAERALLEAGRAAVPVHYDVAAGAARFTAALRGAQAAGAGASAGAGALGVTKAATLTKVGIAFGAALGVAAGYYALHRHAQAPAIEPPAVMHVAAPPAAPVPQHAEPEPDPEMSASAAPTTASERSNSAARPRRRVSRTSAAPAAARGSAHDAPVATPETTAPSATPAPSTTPAPSAPPPQVAAPGTTVKPDRQPAAAQAETPAPSIDELQGIARARVLVNRDPQAALDLLNSVARAHPRGYFVEERNALTILALFGVGQRDAAALRAEKFLHAHPKSPFADRIRAALER